MSWKIQPAYSRSVPLGPPTFARDARSALSAARLKLEGNEGKPRSESVAHLSAVYD